MAAPDDDVDDYMSMAIPDSSKKKPETTLQRRARKQRELEDRKRLRTKEERENEKQAEQEARMSTALDSSNKGFKMLAKLGFNQGGTLGRSENARSEPIQVTVKADRGGIGVDSEKKRKIREAAESEAKRVKADEVDYRERVRLEREERKYRGQLAGAQNIAEKLDLERDNPSTSAENASTKAIPTQKKRLKAINVLYRNMEKIRRESEQSQRLESDLHSRLPSLHRHDDSDLDVDDKIGLGYEPEIVDVDEELEDEDDELDAFLALPLFEQRDKVIDHLRDQHYYCFWCKYQYPDASMDGCPGLTEDDHD